MTMARANGGSLESDHRDALAAAAALAAASRERSAEGQVTVFAAGRLYRRLYFSLQQAWLGVENMKPEADATGEELGRVVRDLVPPAEKDGLQLRITERVKGLLAWTETEGYADWLRERNEECIESSSSAASDDIRRDALGQVDGVMGQIRQAVIQQTDDAGVLLFGLGDLLEQGLCRPDIHRFLGDGGMGSASAEGADGEEPAGCGGWLVPRRSQLGQGSDVLAARSRRPAEVEPADSWWAEFRLRWAELQKTFPLLALPESSPIAAQAGNDYLAVVEAIEGLADQIAEVLLMANARPRWDRDRRELWLGDTLVKKFTHHNRPEHQELLLDGFQEQGWAEWVDDPLAPGKLTQTLRDLNKTLEPGMIRFKQSGNGESVGWERVRPS
jgi:hypothetical protein